MTFHFRITFIMGILFSALFAIDAPAQLIPAPHYKKPAQQALDEARQEAVSSIDWNTTPAVRLELPGISGAWRFNESVFAGDSPPNAEAMAALKRHGVNTLISIDLAAPDYFTALAHGLTYVHVPIHHGRLTGADYTRVLHVLDSRSGHFYLHAGQHEQRAFALAAMATHITEFRGPWRIYYLLNQAQLPEENIGLWYYAVSPLGLELLDRSRSLPGQFPLALPPPPLISWMRQFDESFMVLRDSSRIGWETPPDAVGTTSEYEARTITELTADWLETHPNSETGFRAKMEALHESAANLTEALDAPDRTASNAAWQQLSNACMDCHRTYRDN